MIAPRQLSPFNPASTGSELYVSTIIKNIPNACKTAKTGEMVFSFLFLNNKYI